MAAALADALGADVAKVRQILDANRPVRPARSETAHTRPGRPDDAKLVTALAKGLQLDAATVRAALAKLEAAHEADHRAREAAMFAAVAAQPDRATDAVRAAFEAHRPPRPAK